MVKKKNFWINLFVFLVLFMMMQITDYILTSKYQLVINNKFVFGLVGNNVLAIAASLILLISLFICVRDLKYLWFSFATLSAGAVSNIVSRLLYGGTVDYFRILSIPNFNLEDILIVIGVFYIGIRILFEVESPKKV
jgi:lipoprotein signal peptidase